MANNEYITAGLPPSDTDTTGNNFYITAGLEPEDNAGSTPDVFVIWID